MESSLSRFDAIFARARAERRGALIPYLTAGDPTPAASLGAAQALAAAGADIVELGIPFSDPLADGPVIQRASERALAQGMTLEGVLAMAAQLRRAAPALGILLFGYFNPILRYGLPRFAEAAARAGADGVLVTDLIPEEAQEYCAALAARGLDPVFLAAPTSPDARLERIAAAGRGFLYAVSRTGVTGARRQVPESARQLVARLRRHTALPLALGFGIASPEQVREAAGFADGVVVGTAMVERMHAASLERGPEAAAPAAAALLAELRAGLSFAAPRG